jgi:hypothetical protein
LTKLDRGSASRGRSDSGNGNIRVAAGGRQVDKRRRASKAEDAHLLSQEEQALITNGWDSMRKPVTLPRLAWLDRREATE